MLCYCSLVRYTTATAFQIMLHAESYVSIKTQGMDLHCDEAVQSSTVSIIELAIIIL